MSWTELSRELANQMYMIVYIFAVFVAPLLIIYGILRGVLDAFKK